MSIHTSASVRSGGRGAAAAILLVLGLALGAVIPAQGKVPQKFSTDFTAVLNLGEQGDVDLEFAGRVLHSAPYTRVEFQHPLTMEQIVLLLDASKSTAVLLYPDTLNGLSYDYAGKYYADWPGGFADYLSAAADARPAGWTKTVGKPAADGYVSIKLAKGDIAVECKLDAKSQPSSMRVTTPGHSAAFRFSDYAIEKTLSQSLFEVPSDYAIERVTSLEGEQALPL